MNTSRKIRVLALACAFCCAAAAYGADTAADDADDAAKDARQPSTFKVLNASVDADGDFLVDAFETELINAYAPYLAFSPEETAWPSSVSHHLSNILALRIYDEDKTNEFTTDSTKEKPTTWAEVMGIYSRKCESGAYGPEDLYFALPIDKTMLKPGAPLPGCPSTDFRYERSGSKSIADVYKARVMIPSHRPVGMRVDIIDADGNVYSGTVNLNLFTSSEDKIDDEVKSESFELTCGDKKRTAYVKVESVRKALGLSGSSPLPDGPVPDWSKAEVTVYSHADQLSATYIAPQASSFGTWLTSDKKLSAYYSTGPAAEPIYDLNAIKATWESSIPVPTGGAEIYAHVYPTASYIVVQYWLFCGYSDHSSEEHEADWGDHIDVVLYRTDPEGTAAAATKPLGAITAYRNSQKLTRRMVAMVAYYGSCGQITFKRAQDAPTAIAESRSKYSLSTVKEMRWCDATGTIADNSTHPVVYVAKGSHQMYESGGKHKRMAPTNKFKELWNLATGANDGTDVCAADSSDNKFGGDNAPRVLPQTTAATFSGQAAYKSGDTTSKLSASSATLKAVNVGELTSKYRENLMRYDGKVCKELVKAWGHALPAESEAAEAQKDAIRAILKTELEAKIKTAFTAVKDTETSTKGTVKEKAEARVAKIKSKLVTDIISAKKTVKKSYASALEADLNALTEELIRDAIGIRTVKPVLMLARTKPLAGGEFVDYPGRWGRLLSTSGLSTLETKDIGNYCSYNMPDDDDMKMLRKWRWSGPVGPAGAKPERYLAEFYRDYDSVAKEILVYGVEIDL